MLGARRLEAEMFVGQRRGHAAALGAIEQAQLHQVRLVNLLDGIFFFAERSGDGIQAHGAAGKFLDDREHEIAVHFVEAVFIDAEPVERFAGDVGGDAALRAHFGEVAHAAQQAIGDARSAAAAARHLFGAARLQEGWREFAPSGAKSRRDPRAGNTPADARCRSASAAGAVIRPARVVAPTSVKRFKLNGWMRAPGTLTDDEIDPVILHGGIENLFDCGKQAMNLVEEKHLADFERGENRGEIALALEQRTGTGFDARRPAHWR